MQKRRRSSLIPTLLFLGIAAAVSLVWWWFARAQSTRPTASDAIFVRRIEDFIRKG